MKKSNVLLSVMLCGTALFGCGQQEMEVQEPQPQVQQEVIEQQTEPQQATEEQTPIEEQEETVLRVGLNETLYNDKVEVTFTNAYYTDDRNEFSDKVADKVFVLEFEYKNVGIDDEWALFEGIDFVVYDEDGRRLQTYPVSTNYGGTVSKGRMSSSSEAFAVVGDSTHFEIEIGGAIVEFDLE